MLLSQFPLILHQIHDGILILMFIEMVFVIIWEMFHGSIYLNFASAASEFCEAVQFGTDVLIAHHKYQVNSWFKPSQVKPSLISMVSSFFYYSHSS